MDRTTNSDTAGSETDYGEITRLLGESEPSPENRARLVTLLYPELKRIAEMHMRRERRDHTLQATALVSEFFVHAARQRNFSASNRTHFLMAASEAMRRLLVDYARAHKTEKRGGRVARLQLDGVDAPRHDGTFEILEIDELLGSLAAEDERMARIVELKFFGGLNNTEIGDALGIHERTVKRDWQVARAWLYARLRGGDNHDGRGMGPD